MDRAGCVDGRPRPSWPRRAPASTTPRPRPGRPPAHRSTSARQGRRHGDPGPERWRWPPTWSWGGPASVHRGGRAARGRAGPAGHAVATTMLRLHATAALARRRSAGAGPVRAGPLHPPARTPGPSAARRPRCSTVTSARRSPLRPAATRPRSSTCAGLSDLHAWQSSFGSLDLQTGGVDAVCDWPRVASHSPSGPQRRRGPLRVVRAGADAGEQGAAPVRARGQTDRRGPDRAAGDGGRGGRRDGAGGRAPAARSRAGGSHQGGEVADPRPRRSPIRPSRGHRAGGVRRRGRPGGGAGRDRRRGDVGRPRRAGPGRRLLGGLLPAWTSRPPTCPT